MKKEEKKREGISPDVEREIKKGKGYATILANIVGDLRKHDIKKATKLNEKKEPGIIKKFLKSLGWSYKEAAIMEDEIKGKKHDDIAEKDIVTVETLKENEIRVELVHFIGGINKSDILRFRGKDYFVLDIITSEERKTTTYHLKEC